MRHLPLCLLLALAACADDPSGTDAGGTTSLPVLTALPLRSDEAIVVDGMNADPAWKRMRALEVPLEGEGPSSVRLKAAHDGMRIYFQAIWHDRELSLGSYWKHRGADRFERHLGEDGLSICWSPGTLAPRFRAQGCALFCHDERHVFPESGRGLVDFWYWGAQQTAAFPQARDLALRFGTEHRLRGDAQPDGSDNILNESGEYEGPAYFPQRLTRNGDRFLHVGNQQAVTPGQLRMKLTRNPEGGREIPLYLVRARKGSRGDVAATARYHKEKGWLLELSRELETGNSDDLPLVADPTVPYHFSLALHDGSHGAAHAVSGPIELRLSLQRE